LADGKVPTRRRENSSQSKKSLFARRIKIQGFEKIKKAGNKGFSQGVILRESKNEGAGEFFFAGGNGANGALPVLQKRGMGQM
jgi:hypothetical protein